jgi:haloacetate dehalogenase
MIEDYRAGATTDLADDREDQAQGRRVQCPVQILWSASSKASPTPLEIWRDWALQVEGGAIDCGHMMAEEAPDEVLAAVLPFLLKHGT